MNSRNSKLTSTLHLVRDAVELQGNGQKGPLDELVFDIIRLGVVGEPHVDYPVKWRVPWAGVIPIPPIQRGPAQ